MTQPVFAVVGHPNKGKSSIVATLAQDDSVRIAAESGTTVRCRAYPMRVDGQVIYSLVDTPGFQRPRQTLAWMRQRCANAAERATVVRQFVNEHRPTDRFPDECELLSPIMEGAGVIYVVDGSRPYGPEYEAEMEILRWTGQPGMALINPIRPENYIEQWESALRQYFSIVRVFNAMASEFPKRLSLLRAFGELRDPWRTPLQHAVTSLEQDRRRRHEQAAAAITEMFVDMLTLTVEKHIGGDDDLKPVGERLREKYHDRLRKREERGRREVEAIFDWHTLERHEPAMEIETDDLFDTDRWYLWGLNRRQLTARGAAAGAALGGAIDLGVGGASFLLGTVIGGAIGGATGWFGAPQLEAMKVGPLPLGGKVVRVGPARHRNFPYVILGRALHHHARVTGRTHAHRETLDLGSHCEAGSWYDALSVEQRKQMDRLIDRCTRLEDDTPKEALAELIQDLLRRVDDSLPA